MIYGSSESEDVFELNVMKWTFSWKFSCSMCDPYTILNWDSLWVKSTRGEHWIYHLNIFFVSYIVVGTVHSTPIFCII